MTSISGTTTENDSFLAVTFYIRETHCGVNTSNVQEVVNPRKVTPVHHSVPYILGLINLRGKIVTIIDLGKKLGFGDTAPTDESRILILSWNNEYIGVLVDKVADVIAIDPSSLSERPSLTGGIPSSFYEGVYREKDSLIGLLDINVVLSPET
jgi:purine-binding chemotaxis protein CheW